MRMLFKNFKDKIISAITCSWIYGILIKQFIGNCVVCGSKEAVVLSQKGMFKTGESIGIRNIICKQCGLVYNWPQISLKKIEEFYRKNYLNKQYGLNSFEDIKRRLLLKNSDKKARETAEFFRDFVKNKKVIEVGCSYGSLLAAIKNYFSPGVVFGVEPGDLAGKFAKEYYKLNIFNDTLQNYINNDLKEKFDFLILSHTFEHFSDPVKTLGIIKNLLNENGCIYIEVPNILPNSIGLARPTSLIFEPGHFFSYSPKTLCAMLQKVGFKIIRYDFKKHGNIHIIAALKKSKFEEIFFEINKGDDIKKIIRKIKINNIKHLILQPILKNKYRASKFLRK